MPATLTLLTLGGLANRMRAIASAAALARSSNRPLKVIWPVNRELHARFEELFRPLPAGITLQNIPEAKALWVYRPARKRNLFLSPLLRLGRFSAILSDNATLLPGKATETAAAIKNTTGEVLLRAGTFFYPCEPQDYRSLFIPQPEIRQAADNILRSNAEIPVGFHIRRTDNAVAIASSPLESFVERAKSELGASPHARIYLATDDDEVKSMFHRRFPGRIITTDATADRLSAEGMRHALTEMLILAGCSRIIGSFYSSYSEAAAILGDTPLEQIKATPE